MNDKLISVIVVSHNSKKWLKKCLESLFCQSCKNLEVIIVDNNSSDGSADYIKENYSQVRLIAAEKNLGFAGGVNLGIKNSLGDYVLMLNPDTWLEKDFLKQILEFYLKNKFDVVGPLEADYNGAGIKNKNFVSKIDPFGFSVLVGNSKTNNQDQFNLCGFCLFFEKRIYWDTGGLDYDFFMYIEEIDWFWRLALYGKKIGLVENLWVHHAGSGAGQKPSGGLKLRKKIFLWRNRNILQMMLKNYSIRSLVLILPAYFVQNIFEALIFALAIKPGISVTYFQGWWFNIHNIKSILGKRKHVQRKRILSDWQIYKKHGYFGIGKLKLLWQIYTKKMNPYKTGKFPDNSPYSTRNIILNQIGKKKTVLDLGCNDGYYGKFSDRTNKFYGVDISQQAIARARANYAEVFLANLNDFTELPWRFKCDVLIFSDVLEHLHHPRKVLRFYTDRYLKDGGKVIISLPNIANFAVRAKLLFGKFEYTDSGILDKTHLHFYTFKSAQKLAGDAGLKTLAVHSGASIFGSFLARVKLFRGLLATGIIIVAEKDA